MAGDSQPLSNIFAIVGQDGTPTDYFIRWAQDRQIDIGEAITEEQAQQFIADWAAARQIIAGRALDGGGALSSDVTIDHTESLVVPGTYGDATHVPQFVVDQEGHIQGVVLVEIATGAVVWGTITGTLSDQTDLQAALDAKANLIGGNSFTGNQILNGDLTLTAGSFTAADGSFSFMGQTASVAAPRIGAYSDFHFVDETGFGIAFITVGSSTDPTMYWQCDTIRVTDAAGANEMLVMTAANVQIKAANVTELTVTAAGVDFRQAPSIAGTPLGTAAMLASDTDGTLAANSDVRIATQKATKTYVDNAVTGLLDFKGAIDASANPNYPAALKGDAYVISVSGKVGGAAGIAVDIGDVVLAIADNAGGTQAAVGASWDQLEHNLVGALLSANNLSDLGNAATARGNLGLGYFATGTDAANLTGTLPVGVIGAASIVFAKIQNVAATKLLGNPTGGAAAPSEINLGEELSFSGTTLHGAVVHPGYVAGKWYCPVRANVIGGGAAIPVNSIRLLPFTLSKPFTVSDLGARVSTLSAGGNFQLAIYANNPATGRPTGNALCSTGNISTGATGPVSATVGASVLLPPGTYWMAINQDNSVAVYNTIASTNSHQGYLIGSATLANITASSGNVALYLFVAQTFGTWPDLTSAAFTESTNTNNALVFLKAA